MTMFKCKLKTLSNLVKLVTYTNTKTNIHVIHYMQFQDDKSIHRTYFIYYGGGKEYYYCEDPPEVLSEGLFMVDYMKKDIDMNEATRLYYLSPRDYDTSKIYIFIIGVEDVEFE
ncbi:MAG: hypothetical protein ACE5J3_04495 [Methanosarcinales archaeon]